MVEQKLICQECNQEYTLSGEDNPEDYECVCGGDLRLVEKPVPEPNKESDIETGAEGRKKRRRPKPEHGHDIAGSGGRNGGFKLKLFLISIFLIFIIAFAFSGGSELTYEELLEKYGRPESEVIRASDYVVFLQDYERLKDMTAERAKDIVSPEEDDAEYGISLIDYGEKTIEGVTLYYGIYEDTNINEVQGDGYFQIDNRWYSILWYDKPGNPNRGRIESQIAEIIRDAKKVV